MNVEITQWAYTKAKAVMPQAGKGYHTIEHVDTMLRDLEQIAHELSPKEYEDLFVAICMHDIVHSNHPGKDEKQSANFFCTNVPAKYSTRIGFSRVNRIAELIQCTDYSKSLSDFTKGNRKLMEIIRDLDRMCFSTIERCVAADEQLRIEAAKLGMQREEFIQRRCAFYKDLAEQIKTERVLYNSAFFRNFNLDAYLNITARIEAMHTCEKHLSISAESIRDALGTRAYFKYNASTYADSDCVGIKDAQEHLHALYDEIKHYVVDEKSDTGLEVKLDLFGEQYHFEWRDFRNDASWKRTISNRKLKAALTLIDSIYDRGLKA